MTYGVKAVLGCIGFFSLIAYAQEQAPQGFEITYRTAVSETDAMSLGIGSPVLWGSARFGIEAGKRFYFDTVEDDSKYADATGTDFGVFFGSSYPATERVSIPVTLHFDYNTYRKKKEMGTGTESSGHLSLELDSGLRLRSAPTESFFADVGWLYRSSFLPEKLVIVGKTLLRKSEPGVFIRLGYTFQ